MEGGSFSFFTFTLPMCFCSYFGNVLMQRCNFMKSLYENKTTAKKYTFKRNNSLHVYYASLNEQENLQKQVDQHERTFMIIIFIVIKVLWA